MEMLSGAQMVVRALEDQEWNTFSATLVVSVLDIMTPSKTARWSMSWCGTSRPQCTWRTVTPAHRQGGHCAGDPGPGATNCITGIATAYMDSIPW